MLAGRVTQGLAALDRDKFRIQIPRDDVAVSASDLACGAVLLHSTRAPMRPPDRRRVGKTAEIMGGLFLFRNLSFVEVCREFNSRQIPTIQRSGLFGQFGAIRRSSRRGFFRACFLVPSR